MVRQARAESAAPEMQFDVAVSVRVFNGRKVVSWNNDESCLFLTFTYGAGPRRFVDFALAPWKFREARQRHICRAPTHKNFSGRFNNRNSDSNGRRHVV